MTFNTNISLPNKFRGDQVIAAFRLPVDHTASHSFQAVIMTATANEEYEALRIGAEGMGQYWVPLSEYNTHTGEDALTDAWSDFQNLMAGANLPIKW